MRPYPARLEPDEDGSVVLTFPDIPEAITVGDTEEQALERGHDALLVALCGYMDRRLDIPRASRSRSPYRIAVPPMAAAKLAIYQAMRDNRVSQTQLAAKLRCDARQVRRLLDLDHHSRLDHLENALAALGKRLIIEVATAA